jgi:hypothetical protein
MADLAIKAVADKQPRMGRPPLKVSKTTVRLPVDATARIEALVGKQRVATFIREAVEEALKRSGG